MVARDYKRNRGRREGFSGWTGLFIGFVAGLSVGLALYLFDPRDPGVPQATVEAANPPGPASASEAAEKKGAYVLQAGSYRKFEDADRVRAQLALQGIESNVQRVAIDSDTWHRVRIGPITDPAELVRVRTRLKEAEVDFLVVRVGD